MRGAVLALMGAVRLLLLMVVATVATLVPARRAALIDPLPAVQAEQGH